MLTGDVVKSFWGGVVRPGVRIEWVRLLCCVGCPVRVLVLVYEIRGRAMVVAWHRGGCGAHIFRESVQSYVACRVDKTVSPYAPKWSLRLSLIPQSISIGFDSSRVVGTIAALSSRTYCPSPFRSPVSPQAR